MQQQQPRPAAPAPLPPLRPEAVLDALRPGLLTTIPVFFLTLLLRGIGSPALGLALMALPFVGAVYFGSRHWDRRLAAIAGAAFVLVAPAFPALLMLPLLAALAATASTLKHHIRG